MADIRSCSNINGVKDRMDCIEKQLALVNSALEAVAKELRNAVPPGLKLRLEELEAAALKYGDIVMLSSCDPTKNEDRNLCLTFMDRNAATQTRSCGAGASYAQGWKVRKPAARKPKKRAS